MKSGEKIVDGTAGSWRCGDERNLDSRTREETREIVHRTFETTDAVQRIHGAGDDGQAQRP
jgi:hypothetical protein